MTDGMTSQFTDGYPDTQATENIQQWTGDGATLVYKSAVEATDVKTVECWESGSWAEKTETTEWAHDNPASDTVTVTFVDGNEPSAAVAAVYTLTYAAKAGMATGDFHTITTQDASTYAVWFNTVARVAQVETVTFETLTNSDDGDFIVVTSQLDGLEYAVALDKTGTSAEPTATEWLAVDSARRVQCDVSGETTAANVAAAVEVSFATLSANITTNDTADDGSMSFTQDVAGPCADAVSYKEDGESSDITWSTGTNGAGSAYPTSTVYTSIVDAKKAMCDISGATDAASVAAAAEVIWDGLTGFTAKCVTSDATADGTMTFTMQTVGDCSDPTDYAFDSTTDGDSANDWAETTQGKTNTLRITFYQPSSTLSDGIPSGL